MAKVIAVGGGFSGVVVIDLVDSLKQLGDSAFSVALTPVGQSDPPNTSALVWQGVPASPAAGSVVLSFPIEDTVTPGVYNVAVDVQRAGRHEVVWVMDPSRRGRRALVVLT